MERGGETWVEAGGTAWVAEGVDLRPGRRRIRRVAVAGFVLVLVAGLYLPPGGTHLGLGSGSPISSPKASAPAIAATDLEAVFDTLSDARTRQAAGRQAHAFSWPVSSA